MQAGELIQLKRFDKHLPLFGLHAHCFRSLSGTLQSGELRRQQITWRLALMIQKIEGFFSLNPSSRMQINQGPLDLAVCIYM